MRRVDVVSRKMSFRLLHQCPFDPQLQSVRLALLPSTRSKRSTSPRGEVKVHNELPRPQRVRSFPCPHAFIALIHDERSEFEDMEAGKIFKQMVLEMNH